MGKAGEAGPCGESAEVIDGQVTARRLGATAEAAAGAAAGAAAEAAAGAGRRSGDLGLDLGDLPVATEEEQPSRAAPAVSMIGNRHLATHTRG